MLVGFLLLAGCAEKVGPEYVCVEVGYALASRTEECTGDTERAVALQEAYEADWDCRMEDAQDAEAFAGLEKDLYECPLVLRNLACELVEDYDDDLSLWMSSSDTCGLVVAPR